MLNIKTLLPKKRNRNFPKEIVVEVYSNLLDCPYIKNSYKEALELIQDTCRDEELDCNEENFSKYFHVVTYTYDSELDIKTLSDLEFIVNSCEEY